MCNILFYFYFKVSLVWCLLFFFSHIVWHVGSYFPDQVSNLHTLHCQHRVLTTGLPEKYWYLLTFKVNTHCSIYDRASQVALMVKNPPANAGDLKDASSIPGSRRSPGGGHGNPLQYSCLENPMDRGAW